MFKATLTGVVTDESGSAIGPISAQVEFQVPAMVQNGGTPWTAFRAGVLDPGVIPRRYAANASGELWIAIANDSTAPYDAGLAYIADDSDPIESVAMWKGPVHDPLPPESVVSPRPDVPLNEQGIRYPIRPGETIRYCLSGTPGSLLGLVIPHPQTD